MQIPFSFFSAFCCLLLFLSDHPERIFPFRDLYFQEDFLDFLWPFSGLLSVLKEAEIPSGFLVVRFVVLYSLKFHQFRFLSFIDAGDCIEADSKDIEANIFHLCPAFYLPICIHRSLLRQDISSQ